MGNVQAVEEPTPPKKKRGRGRPKKALGATGFYPSRRKPARRGAKKRILKNAKRITIWIEESDEAVLIVRFGSITEGIRALILAHLKEQPPKPASATEAEAGSRDSR